MTVRAQLGQAKVAAGRQLSTLGSMLDRADVSFEYDRAGVLSPTDVWRGDLGAASDIERFETTRFETRVKFSVAARIATDNRRCFSATTVAQWQEVLDVLDRTGGVLAR